MQNGNEEAKLIDQTVLNSTQLGTGRRFLNRCYFFKIPYWYLRDAEVGGSNPLAPTLFYVRALQEAILQKKSTSLY